MIDLLSAAQVAFYNALQGASDNADVPTYSAVPQDADVPYRLIADIDTESEAPGGQGQFERLQVEVHSVYRGASRAALLAIMHNARLVLDGAPLTAEGAHFEPARFLKSAVSRAGPDGVTFVGVSVFETWGQPAD